MSEEAENIYDADGNIKDDIYNLSTCSHYEEAEKLVLGRLLNKNKKNGSRK